jgi:hypothetical protein
VGTNTKSGFGHLHVAWSAEGVLAGGTIIRARATEVFTAHYEICCDTRWRVRRLRAAVITEPKGEIVCDSDARGHWTVNGRGNATAFDGCFDVDISATPFTNSLPIRRMSIAKGESVEIAVVYVALPDLTIKPVRQRYTCLARHDEGGRYHYESLASGFTAEISVDADGFVLDYPGVFRRIWP